MVGQGSRLQWEALLVWHLVHHGAQVAPGASRLAWARGLSHAPRCYQLSLVEEQASTMSGKDSLVLWEALLVVRVRRQRSFSMIGQDSLLLSRHALSDEQAHPMFGQDSLLPRSEVLVDEQAQPMIGQNPVLRQSQAGLDEPAHQMIGQVSLLPPRTALLDERAHPM